MLIMRRTNRFNQLQANNTSHCQGPLLAVKHFDIYIIKICSMHAVNLGLVYTANGSVLILELNLRSCIWCTVCFGLSFLFWQVQINICKCCNQGWPWSNWAILVNLMVEVLLWRTFCWKPGRIIRPGASWMVSFLHRGGLHQILFLDSMQLFENPGGLSWNWKFMMCFFTHPSLVWSEGNSCKCAELVAYHLQNKVVKACHGAYLTAKAFNGRIIVDWLRDCAERAHSGSLPNEGSRRFGCWLKSEVRAGHCDWPVDNRLLHQRLAMIPNCNLKSSF